MKPFNIHMTGVGGQGIGLLSQALLRGIDHAGITAVAVDTHGLAQRGGTVVSRIRCGEPVYSPLIMAGCADLVLGMEVHEALRGLTTALKPGGTLLFLNVSWQPLPVRLGQSPVVTDDDIHQAGKSAGARVIPDNSSRSFSSGKAIQPDNRLNSRASISAAAARVNVRQRIRSGFAPERSSRIIRFTRT